MQPTQKSTYCIVQQSQVEETVRDLNSQGFQMAITTTLKDGLVRIDAVRIKQLTDTPGPTTRRNAFVVSKEEENEWKKKHNIFNC